MKTFQDVQAVLRLELIHWFPIQIREEYQDFYLYHMPTTAEHNGALVIRRTAPNQGSIYGKEYQIVAKVRKDFTIDQNHKMLSDLCWHLPILEV